MTYSIQSLAKLSGISTRTLRYYDEIGLLVPKRQPNGYRIYETPQVDRLQQILFYRTLDVSLEEIGTLLADPAYHAPQVLQQHLQALRQKKANLEAIIHNVEKTIACLKEGKTMTDQEKFEGLKQQYIQENEAAYGTEIREKYGHSCIEASNQKLQQMTQLQWDQARNLEQEIAKLLAEAVTEGDPRSAVAQQVCDLHRQWLCMYWKDGTYSKAAHQAMGQLYTQDERFRAYYDQIAPDGAAFLQKALDCYCAQ